MVQQVRVPNLPIEKMVDSNGQPTPTEMTFRQTLVTNLQLYFGDEGVVLPSLTAADILLVQNNKIYNSATGVSEYSCGYGRMVYNIDANSIMISVNDGTDVPLFKTVTLT